MCAEMLRERLRPAHNGLGMPGMLPAPAFPMAEPRAGAARKGQSIWTAHHCHLSAPDINNFT